MCVTENGSEFIHQVIDTIITNTDSIAICMSGTGCLQKLAENIKLEDIKSVIETTLLAMESHSKHKQIQKKALLTLSSDRILQNFSTDQFHCCKLVLNSLVNFKNPDIIRMATDICSVMAVKISSKERDDLGGNPIYIERLLKIVQVRDGSDDDNMWYVLNTLWKLTIDSPKTCEMFILKDGIGIYFKVLKVCLFCYNLI